mmetsp:Transcript_12897/g.55409  ORF Transcript_12897/g.55409 Transcript_12897/m.55409 type:complete len:229 (-) Transcript_12897:940-1626(-)
MGRTGIRPVAAASAASLCACIANSPRLVKRPNAADARLRYRPCPTRIPRPAPRTSQCHMSYARSIRGLMPWLCDMQWNAAPGRGRTANQPSPSPWLANIHLGAASIVRLRQPVAFGTFMTPYFSSDSFRGCSSDSIQGCLSACTAGCDSNGFGSERPDRLQSSVSGCLLFISIFAFVASSYPPLNMHTWCVYDHHSGAPATAVSAASLRISWSIIAPQTTCVPTPRSL